MSSKRNRTGSTIAVATFIALIFLTIVAACHPVEARSPASLPPSPEEVAQAELIASAVLAPAVRTGDTVQEVAPTTTTTVLTFADDCSEMSWYRQQAGLPAAFDKIGWRESNCRNEDGVRTSCCHGWWQLHRMHFDGSGYVYGEWCDVRSYTDVNSDTPEDKARQACAAKALYDKVGLSAWSTS